MNEIDDWLESAYEDLSHHEDHDDYEEEDEDEDEDEYEEESETISVLTQPCIHCHKPSIVQVDPVSFYEWQHGGAFVQDAFPDWPADQRELLISGTHPECWDALMGDDGEE